MRRNELFEMLPLPRKIAKRGIERHKADDRFSYFSQMEPKKNAPTFSRPKGASAASAMRRQANGEIG